MKTINRSLLIPALFGAAMTTAAAARAEYKCDKPATRIDRQACEAAKQGPEALSRFIHRMRVVENLYFLDYVNEAQALAWREKAEPAQTAARKAR